MNGISYALSMARLVTCAVLKRELPGLEFAPLPGELGARIYREISAEAWALWLRHSTMVINELRLNPADPQQRPLLFRQLEQFLFSGGAAPPPDFVPPEGAAGRK